MKSQWEDLLYERLIRLGDMMGDGLHLEPGGKWIEKEYEQILIELGIDKPKKRKSNVQRINEYMANRLKVAKCLCGSELKQTRSGSFIGVCDKCGKRFILGKLRKNRSHK